MGCDRSNGGRWCLIVTLIGYVTLVVYAGFAQPERRPPVTESGQAIQGRTYRGADRQQRPSLMPGWLLAIEAGEKASAADCGDAKECRAEQRNYSDLRAQWHAAEGAHGQLYFARWQTWLGGAGTVLIFFALLFSARATKAAVKSNKIARDTYIADQRLWVAVTISPGGPAFLDQIGARIKYKIAVENTEILRLSASVRILRRLPELTMSTSNGLKKNCPMK